MQLFTLHALLDVYCVPGTVLVSGCMMMTIVNQGDNRAEHLKLKLPREIEINCCNYTP